MRPILILIFCCATALGSNSPDYFDPCKQVSVNVPVSHGSNRLAWAAEPMLALSPPSKALDVGWMAHAKAAEGEALERMRAVYATPEGKKEIEEILETWVETWNRPGKYPPGLTPDIWDPLRPRVSNLADFFRVLNEVNHLRGVTANVLNDVGMARMTQGIPGGRYDLPTYRKWVQLHCALTVAAESAGN